MSTYIIVDLEATCWKTGPLAAFQREESEIIEIGAVRLEGSAVSGWEVVDEFTTFIKPAKHPTLSPFCKELTTITQADVDAAPGFEKAWDLFLTWVGDADDPGVILASWGRYDWNQIRKQCRAASIHNPWEDQSRHVNVKEVFTTWRRNHGYGKKRFGLGGAVSQLGITFEGTAHRGIDDAKNIAKVFKHIYVVSNMSRTAKALYSLVRTAAPNPLTSKEVREAASADELGEGISKHVKSWWVMVLNELTRLELVEINSGKVSLRA